METKEKIKVYIDIQDGKTICICKRSNKGCGKKCEPDVVERDKFAGWKSTFPPQSVWAVAAGRDAQERYMTYE